MRAASLAYFGKEPRRLTVAEAALLVALPQLPERRRPDRDAGMLYRARPGAGAALAAGAARRARGARGAASRCRGSRSSCRRSPPILPRRRWRRAPAGAPPRLTIVRRRAAKAWSRWLPSGVRRLGGTAFGRDGAGRCGDRRDPRLRRLGRFLRRRPRRLNRHDAHRPLAGLDAQALHLRARLRAGPGRPGDADRGPPGRLRRLPAEAIST